MKSLKSNNYSDLLSHLADQKRSAQFKIDLHQSGRFSQNKSIRECADQSIASAEEEISTLSRFEKLFKKT